MKFILAIFFFLLSSGTSFGQDAIWGKSDRESVYNECLAYLSDSYKHLSVNQRETISLCFLDRVTSKYTKDVYQAKIDVELRRIKSATIGECARTHDIELNAPAPVVSPIKVISDTPTKANLVGRWKEKTEDIEFVLSGMGTFTMVTNGKRSTGKWQLDGMKLTLYVDRLFGKKERVYNIEIFKPDNFGYTSSKGTFYNVSRVK